MKIFKSYKTKKQLRKEIAELKGMLHLQKPQIHIVECEVQKVSSDMVFDNNVPVECIKQHIAHEMVEFLKPRIEWDVEDDKINSFKKHMYGNIYVAKKKEYESYEIG